MIYVTLTIKVDPDNQRENYSKVKTNELKHKVGK